MAVALKPRSVPSDTHHMRIVLEWLGLVEPEAGRREPVAVPAWAPLAVCAIGAVAIYALSLIARALFG